jgi:hypothetical protein
MLTAEIERFFDFPPSQYQHTASVGEIKKSSQFEQSCRKRKRKGIVPPPSTEGGVFFALQKDGGRDTPPVFLDFSIMVC